MREGSGGQARYPITWIRSQAACLLGHGGMARYRCLLDRYSAQPEQREPLNLLAALEDHVVGIEAVLADFGCGVRQREQQRVGDGRPHSRRGWSIARYLAEGNVSRRASRVPSNGRAATVSTSFPTGPARGGARPPRRPPPLDLGIVRLIEISTARGRAQI